MKILYKKSLSLSSRFKSGQRKLSFLFLFFACGGFVSAQNALDFPTGAAPGTNYVSLPNLLPSGSYTKEA